jgi:hypothetical protein
VSVYDGALSEDGGAVSYDSSAVSYDGGAGSEGGGTVIEVGRETQDGVIIVGDPSLSLSNAREAAPPGSK